MVSAVLARFKVDTALDWVYEKTNLFEVRTFMDFDMGEVVYRLS